MLFEEKPFSNNNFNVKIGTVSTALQRYYYIKDHLGSIRVTTNETGTVVSAQDYFAYGELLREFNSMERYKYTEKERDKETEYDYFGARYYDSELGRWLSVDPFSIKYPSWSSYNYSVCNPTNLVDKLGKYAVRATPALIPFFYYSSEFWPFSPQFIEAPSLDRSLYYLPSYSISQATWKYDVNDYEKASSAIQPKGSGLYEHSSGILKEDTQLKLQLGQEVAIEVKNINVLGTTIRIDPSFPKLQQPQERIILPQETHIFKFYNFGTEPMSWIFDISTASDAFIISYVIRSSWVPGMEPNPLRINPNNLLENKK
ncbi:MAG: hypothetical protein DAHOPDDO_00810 [Ignavibacteriaceae bacterium]|nr:hypothetical protein [Ignavibacteriaceae bacterium]